jgi:hypothetical protein
MREVYGECSDDACALCNLRIDNVVPMTAASVRALCQSVVRDGESFSTALRRNDRATYVGIAVVTFAILLLVVLAVIRTRRPAWHRHPPWERMMSYWDAPEVGRLQGQYHHVSQAL